MLFINNIYTNVYFNLAIEEYLLKNFKEDIFMLGQNNNAIVIGKYQNVEAEINTSFAKEKHIDIARRYSGGGAVYHDYGNINLTFIESTNVADFDKYLQQIVNFLSSIGINTKVDERRGIYVDKYKLSGSAQCIYKNRVMYHCTLLYSTNLDMLRLCLNGNENIVDNKKYRFAVKSVKSEVINICNLIQNPPETDLFKKSIFDFFFNNASGNIIYNLDNSDLKTIEQLKNKKYSAKEWILGK